MKMNKKNINFALVFSVLGLWVALSSSYCDGEERAISKTSTLSTTEIKPDSLAVKALGDSVSSIVFNAKKVVVYKINSTVRPKDSDQTIGGVKVEEKLGKVDRCDIYTLRFLMADSCFYSDYDFKPMVPYMPTMAIEFTSNEGTVSLLFSTISMQMGVVYNGESIKVIRYSYPRLLALLARQITHDEYYNENLKFF